MEKQPRDQRMAIRPHRFRWDWFEVDPLLARQIADVPGVRLSARGDCYEIHRNHLPLLGEEGSGVLEQHHNPLWSHEQRAERVADLTLRAHQQTGLDFIEPRRGVLVGDGMRLGKTLMALLAHDVHAQQQGPLVVLAPLSTRHVWLHWMKVLWPNIEPKLMLSSKPTLDEFKGAEIVFGHHDILTHHQSTSLRPGTLIIDEAHLFSNPNALRTKALLFYASVAWRVLTLTGTPLWNRSKGLWSLLAATSPGAWGKAFDFAQRYCQPMLTEYGWKYNGVSQEAEWALRRAEILLARQWTDVTVDLPPIQYNVETIDLDTNELLKLDTLAFELRKNPTGNRIEDMNYYRQATGLYKVPIAVDLAKRFLAAEDDIVVWVHHRNVGTAIAKKLKTDFWVHGGQSVDERDRILTAWKASPVPAALVIGMDVGQVGIDLSRARHCIFAEIDWTPVVVSQSLMRTFDASRSMSVTFLMLNHEIDRLLLEALRSKVETGELMGVTAAGSMFRLPETDAIADEILLAAFNAAISC